jgi:hypothetical protein
MRDYDIVEKLPDGSFVLRASASGRRNTECKLQEPAEISDNRFYVLNLSAGDSSPYDAKAHPAAPSSTQQESKKDVA